MEPVAPLPTPVTPAQIFSDWAERGHPVTRQYISKLMNRGVRGAKLEGEHLVSLEAAWLFRSRRTAISKLAGGGSPNRPEITAAGANPPRGGSSPSGTLDDMLERARDAEFTAFERWQERLKAKKYDAILAESSERAWKSAASTRVQVENLVEAHKKKCGRSVDIYDAQLLIDERLSPLRSGLQGLDRELAKELFPDNAAVMRPRIRAVIARTLLPAIALAKRRLSPLAA